MTKHKQGNFDFEKLRLDTEFQARAIGLIDKIGLHVAKTFIPRLLHETGSDDQEIAEFMSLVWECYFGPEYASAVPGGQANA